MPKFAVLVCVLLTGCGTMNGLGVDMQRAGAGLSDKATSQHPQHEIMAYPPDADYED